jgi:hypothetical protein
MTLNMSGPVESSSPARSYKAAADILPERDSVLWHHA